MARKIGNIRTVVMRKYEFNKLRRSNFITRPLRLGRVGETIDFPNTGKRKSTSLDSPTFGFDRPLFYNITHRKPYYKQLNGIVYGTVAQNDVQSATLQW